MEKMKPILKFMIIDVMCGTIDTKFIFNYNYWTAFYNYIAQLGYFKTL